MAAPSIRQAFSPNNVSAGVALTMSAFSAARMKILQMAGATPRGGDAVIANLQAQFEDLVQTSLATRKHVQQYTAGLQQYLKGAGDLDTLFESFYKGDLCGVKSTIPGAYSNSATETAPDRGPGPHPRHKLAQCAEAIHQDLASRAGSLIQLLNIGPLRMLDDLDRRFQRIRDGVKLVETLKTQYSHYTSKISKMREKHDHQLETGKAESHDEKDKRERNEMKFKSAEESYFQKHDAVIADLHRLVDSRFSLFDPIYVQLLEAEKRFLALLSLSLSKLTPQELDTQTIRHVPIDPREAGDLALVAHINEPLSPLSPRSPRSSGSKMPASPSHDDYAQSYTPIVLAPRTSPARKIPDALTPRPGAIAKLPSRRAPRPSSFSSLHARGQAGIAAVPSKPIPPVPIARVPSAPVPVAAPVKPVRANVPKVLPSIRPPEQPPVQAPYKLPQMPPRLPVSPPSSVPRSATAPNGVGPAQSSTSGTMSRSGSRGNAAASGSVLVTKSGSASSIAEAYMAAIQKQHGVPISLNSQRKPRGTVPVTSPASSTGSYTPTSGSGASAATPAKAPPPLPADRNSTAAATAAGASAASAAAAVAVKRQAEAAAAAAAAAPAAPQWNAGDSVEVQYSDGAWYIATVEGPGSTGGSYTICFTEYNERMEVDASWIRNKS